MVFSLDDVTYGQLLLYMLILGSTTLLLALLTLAYLIFAAAVKNALFNGIRGCLCPWSTKTTSKSHKHRLNWYKRLFFLVWEFVELVMCVMVSITVLFLVTKYFIESLGYSWFVVTVIVITVLNSVPIFIRILYHRIQFLFNSYTRIGDLVKIGPHMGKIIDIGSHYYVLGTYDEEEGVKLMTPEEAYTKEFVKIKIPFKYVNNNPVIILQQN